MNLSLINEYATKGELAVVIICVMLIAVAILIEKVRNGTK